MKQSQEKKTKNMDIPGCFSLHLINTTPQKSLILTQWLSFCDKGISALKIQRAEFYSRRQLERKSLAAAHGPQGGGEVGGGEGSDPDPPLVNSQKIQLCPTSNRHLTVAPRHSLLPRCLKPFVAAGDSWCEHTVAVDTDSCQTPAQTRPSDVAAMRASHHWSAEDFCPPVMKQVNILDERKHQNADSFKSVATGLQAPVARIEVDGVKPTVVSLFSHLKVVVVSRLNREGN